MTDNLVEITGLTKNYGNMYALDHVDFAVGRGQWVSMMGPSGSGKTTLLNIIGCLDKPSSGQVTVGGTDIGALTGPELIRFRRETVGLVFQQFHLVPYLTAVENVMLAQYFHSVADEAEARQALERVGLGDRLHHLPSQLSGGEQQRVCVARALINQPLLILADEPTGNLDQHSEQLVMEIFRGLHRQGHTLIVVTHDPEVGRMGQTLITLEHGKIVTGDR